MVRTCFSISAMSVSSSHGFTSKRTEDLAISAGFFDFFCCVGSHSLLFDFLCLFVLFIVRAKHVKIVIIIVLLFLLNFFHRSGRSSRGWGRRGFWRRDCRRSCRRGGGFFLQLFHSRAKLRNHVFQVVSDLPQLGVLQLELLQSVGDVDKTSATISAARLSGSRQRLMNLLPGDRDSSISGEFSLAWEICSMRGDLARWDGAAGAA